MKDARFRSSCLICAALVLAVMQLSAGGSAVAQTALASPAFEVATIKVVIMDPSTTAHAGVHVYSARAYYRAMTLKSLVRYAYGVQPFQVSGPAEIDTDHYDIEARYPKGATEKDERKMLQALLKERFKLTFHIDTKKLDSYALVVGKHGAKLKPSLPDLPSPDPAMSSRPGENNVEKGDEHESKQVTNKDGSITIDIGMNRGMQTAKFDMDSWSWHYERNKMNMPELAWQLERCLLSPNGNHVSDETGMKGDFQVSIDCPMAGRPPSLPKDVSDTTPSDPQGGKSVNRSLDAMGLKLEKRKVPLDVYVIDHLEKPSEN